MPFARGLACLHDRGAVQVGILPSTNWPNFLPPRIAVPSRHFFRDKWVRAFPAGRGRGIILDIAHGLAYLHGRGFVHFDLTSRNILLDENYTAKIADMGLARPLEQQASGSGVSAAEVVSSHMGHFTWASPEQLMGEPGLPDFSCLSLSSTLCFTLSGNRVWG